VHLIFRRSAISSSVNSQPWTLSDIQGTRVMKRGLGVRFRQEPAADSKSTPIGRLTNLADSRRAVLGTPRNQLMKKFQLFYAQQPFCQSWAKAWIVRLAVFGTARFHNWESGGGNILSMYKRVANDFAALPRPNFTTIRNHNKASLSRMKRGNSESTADIVAFTDD